MPRSGRSSAPRALRLTALAGIGVVTAGTDLVSLLLSAVDSSCADLCDGDVIVLAQKIVSKSEGRIVRLKDVDPSSEAQSLADRTGKDARVVQCVLDESVEVVRAIPGVLIVRHRSGIVHANAGIDESNVNTIENDPCVLLLPLDADASAARLRDAVLRRTQRRIGVIVADSGGRAWRRGVIGFAIGCAGFEALESWVGAPDLNGRPLRHTEVAVADELAAAASFLMGEADQATPMVLIRGAELRPGGRGAADLVRPLSQDLFR